MRKFVLALLAVCVIGGAAPVAFAQANAPLPPALAAAIQSGNSSAIERAITTLSAGNPIKVAQLIQATVTAAERLVQTNPAAAASAAASASKLATVPSVAQASPQVALSVAVAANRVAISPTVQAVAPLLSATISSNVISTVTSPAVYSVSPAAALQVMSDSYNSVSSPAIAAAAPNALQQVTQTLANAAANPQLAVILQQSGAVITAILTKQNLPSVDGINIISKGTAS